MSSCRDTVLSGTGFANALPVPLCMQRNPNRYRDFPLHSPFVFFENSFERSSGSARSSGSIQTSSFQKPLCQRFLRNWSQPVGKPCRFTEWTRSQVCGLVRRGKAFRNPVCASDRMALLRLYGRVNTGRPVSLPNVPQRNVGFSVGTSRLL